MLCLHTAASARAAVGLGAAWSEFRASATRGQRRAALDHARRIAGSVPVPRGARLLARPALEEESDDGDAESSGNDGGGEEDNDESTGRSARQVCGGRAGGEQDAGLDEEEPDDQGRVVRGDAVTYIV